MSLYKNEIKQKCVRISPNQCTPMNSGYYLQHKRETSFYICQKASLTVEAAVVIPLMMGFFIFIMWFFRILSIQNAVGEALIYTGRILAVESVLTDTEETLYLSTETLLKSKLSQNGDIKRYVSGGVLGVSLLGSKLSEKEICLKVNYRVKLPIDLFGKRGIWLSSQNKFVKWRGDLYSGTENNTWVYITETGSVYHKDTSCRSLDLNIQEGLLIDVSSYRGSNGQRYEACERCIKKISGSQIVYFTDYGELYHGSLSCSALKRTIIRILLSQVGDKRACSFCYK